MSAPDSLFQARSETAEIELMFTPGEPKRCVCCPPDHPHVFCYVHRLEGKSGGYRRSADSMVSELLYQAFHELKDADKVNQHRVRITVELIAP